MNANDENLHEMRDSNAASALSYDSLGILTSDEDSDDVPLVQKHRLLVDGTKSSQQISRKHSRNSTLPPWAGQAYSIIEKKGHDVLVGVWQFSPQALDINKNAVYGYITSADSLLFKVCSQKQDGTPLSPKLGHKDDVMKVQLDRIILDHHLKELTRQELKEYVKTRLADKRPYGSLKDLDDARAQAVKDAKTKVASEHPAKTSRSIQRRSVSVASSSPRRRSISIGEHYGPDRVLLGFWKSSKEGLDLNKHAVYANISEDGSLRVFGVKETRDGRLIETRYPKGSRPFTPFPITIDECELEPHLEDLTVLEIEEYVRLHSGRTGSKSKPAIQSAEDKIVQATERNNYTSPCNSEDQSRAEWRRKRKLSQFDEQPAEHDLTRPGFLFAAQPSNLLNSRHQPAPEGSIQHDGVTFRCRPSGRSSEGEYIGEKKVVVTINDEDYIEFRVLK